jgi:hypothetical protein
MRGNVPVVEGVQVKGFKNADGVTVLLLDVNGNVLDASGTAAPPSAKAGYAIGGIYRRSSVALYINTGTTASCTFTAVGTITNGSILLASLDTGIKPSHIVKFAGKSASETDADASVVITVTGAVAATDFAQAQVVASANAVSVLKTVVTTDTVTVTLSGNGGAGTIVSYAVYRAVA